MDQIDEFDVADLINCSICRERFENPTSFPCLHTFCLKCLKQYGKYEKPGDPVRCPQCRKEYPLPENGFEGFQSNFLVKKLADRLQDKTKTSPDSHEVKNTGYVDGHELEPKDLLVSEKNTPHNNRESLVTTVQHLEVNKGTERRIQDEQHRHAQNLVIHRTTSTFTLTNVDCEHAPEMVDHLMKSVQGVPGSESSITSGFDTSSSLGASGFEFAQLPGKVSTAAGKHGSESYNLSDIAYSRNISNRLANIQPIINHAIDKYSTKTLSSPNLENTTEYSQNNSDTLPVLRLVNGLNESGYDTTIENSPNNHNLVGTSLLQPMVYNVYASSDCV